MAANDPRHSEPPVCLTPATHIPLPSLAILSLYDYSGIPQLEEKKIKTLQAHPVRNPVPLEIPAHAP